MSFKIQSYVTMKIENENAKGVQTPSRKSYNPFDSDDEDTNAYANSSFNGYDIKSLETTAESLTFNLDSIDMSWEEAILEHSRMLQKSVTTDANSEDVIYKEDTEHFTEKTIPEYKVPEFLCSHNENGFHSVKDIGIDEGVPKHDEVWIKTQNDHDSKGLSDLGSHCDVTTDLPFKEDLRSRPNNDVEEDSSAQCRSEDSEENGHEVLEKTYSAVKCKADLLQVDEFDHDLRHKEIGPNSNGQGTAFVKCDNVINDIKDPSINDKDEDCQKVEKTRIEVGEEQHCNGNILLQESEEYPGNPLIEHEVKAKVDSNENLSEEAASVKSVELSAIQKPVGNGVTNTVPYNSKVESGSIILDFKASTKVLGKETEEIPQTNEEVEKPPETQTMSREDGGAPGQSILDNGTDKRVHGETSFSAAMPLPASITYMGPHAHNGSISHRSESSTGSTRSFAFPVLQTEWNSSPVRMAKPDQRHFHKQRGWVHSLICCKF